MASWIAPRTVEFEPTAPPWGWNPAATFLTAYTTMQENQRAQQEFAVQQELEQYLLPIKKRSAELSLANMELEMEKTKGELDRQTILTRRLTEGYRNANGAINSAVSNPATNTSQNKTDDPLSFNISTAATQKQPSVASNSSYVLGGGVQPVSGQ